MVDGIIVDPGGVVVATGGDDFTVVAGRIDTPVVHLDSDDF